MRKLFILSLLAMMIAIGGCGSGGTSADPLGTDSITFADAAGSGTSQVNPNGAVSLKATVKNAAGTAVVGREVSFTLVSNASGAALASPSANTNGAGEATILYTAGTTAGYDVVRASISNGANMDVNITVGGGGGSSTSTYGITVTAAPATLSIIGGNSVITANVKNNLGTVVSGVTVNFTVTGAATVLPLSAITDVSGNAVTIFTGDPGSLTTETDVVTASITDTVSGNNYTAAVVTTNP